MADPYWLAVVNSLCVAWAIIYVAETTTGGAVFVATAVTISSSILCGWFFGASLVK